MIVSAHACVVLCKSFDMNTAKRLKVNKNTLFMKRKTIGKHLVVEIFPIESDHPSTTVHPCNPPIQDSKFRTKKRKNKILTLVKCNLVKKFVVL